MNIKLHRLYDFFRYDILYGIKNLFHFFNVVWNFRSWDSIFVLNLFKVGLFYLYKNIEKHEYEVDKMKEVLYILDVIIKGRFIEIAEKELGIEYVLGPTATNWSDKGLTKKEIDNNNKISKRTKELENIYWNELWDIIKGSGYFSLNYKENEIKFDGSDMRSWWD